MGSSRAKFPRTAPGPDSVNCLDYGVSSSFQFIELVLGDLVSARVVAFERHQETWAVPAYAIPPGGGPIRKMTKAFGIVFWPSSRGREYRKENLRSVIKYVHLTGEHIDEEVLRMELLQIRRTIAEQTQFFAGFCRITLLTRPKIE